MPSAPQGKPATPQHKRSGLLTQLSALNSEKQELTAQLEAAQATLLEYKAESEAAGKESAEASADPARLQAQVKLPRPYTDAVKLTLAQFHSGHGLSSCSRMQGDL